MPKSTRSSSGGQLRSHSRSSSGTRLGANLQFTATAKDVQPAKPPPGGKKAGAGAQPQTGVYDAHHGAKPPFVRANSSQRVHSREQLARRLAPLQQPPPAQQQQQQQYAKANGKGFSIQAQAVDAGEDDEDEWESENGAATPNQDDSGSDTASENGPDQEFPDQVAPQQQYPEQQQQQLDPRRQPPAMTAQQEQNMLQQRKEAEMQHQLYLRQRQLEAQHRQQQKADQERHLLQQQQQQQEQYQQELRLQQQRQIQAQQQQQQQQHQQQQQQQGRQLQQQEQQQLYLQQQQQQQQLYQQQHPPHIQTGFPVEESALARVNTARPSDFEHALRSERPTPRTTAPPKQQQQEPAQPQTQPPQRQQTTPQPQPSADQPSMDRRPHTPRSDSEPVHQTASATGDTSEAEAPRHSPRPKHLSRPPSSHSIRSDHGLRPHPLFRGLTQGVSNPVPRPAPLAPLTVLPASAALPAISTSPSSSIVESLNGRQHLSSSPTTSIRTASGSPAGSEPPYSAYGPGRRMSISSARSAASTLPPQSASGRETVWTHDRTRTLSTMSTASSSAALSSLANLPSVTRPPSPQTIAFFPPVNPHSNVEAIHPLLPGPYLHNHLTVLSRRTPIRESFDRVMRAKNAR